MNSGKLSDMEVVPTYTSYTANVRAPVSPFTYNMLSTTDFANLTDKNGFSLQFKSQSQIFRAYGTSKQELM